MVYCVVPFTPSPDPQRSSVRINNIETRTAINDIIASDEYQALLWNPQQVCLGFLLKQTLWALKNLMNVRHSIYLTFGHWGVQAVLDISNFRPLKVKLWYRQELFCVVSENSLMFYHVCCSAFIFLALVKIRTHFCYSLCVTFFCTCHVLSIVCVINFTLACV
jgi:hypothetical protein